jgi:hypothetical protein
MSPYLLIIFIIPISAATHREVWLDPFLAALFLTLFRDNPLERPVMAVRNDDTASA